MMYITAVTILFGSGMPALYPIACAFFFISYWIDKWLLLRYYRKPDSYDTSLANKHLNFYFVILVMHVLVGTVMYANSAICETSTIFDFTTEWAIINRDPKCWDDKKDFNFKCGSRTFRLFQHFKQGYQLDFNQVHVLLFFLILPVFALVYVVTDRVIKHRKRKQDKKSLHETIEEENPQHDFYRCCSFTTLNNELEDANIYRHQLEAFKNKSKTLKNKDDVDSVLKGLNQKIKAIEDVIQELA